MECDFRRIKLFFSNGIGDWIMTLPTVRAFVRTFGDEVGFVVGDDLPPELLDEFTSTLIETVAVLRPRGSREVVDFNSIGRCDVFVSLNPWHHDSVLHLAVAVGAKLTIGHFPEFSVYLPVQAVEHSVDMSFRMFQFFRPTASVESFSEGPYFSNPASTLVSRIRNYSNEKTLVSIHTETSANKQPSFFWIDRLLSEIRSEIDCIFFMVGNNSLIEHLPMVDLEIVQSLGTCMQAVAESDFFVGVDSCMLHVADLCRKPGVGLFVSTDPREFGFRFSNSAISVDAKLPNESISRALSVVHRFKREFISFQSDACN